MYKLLLFSLFSIFYISLTTSHYTELPHCEQNLTGIILVSTLDGKVSTLNSSGALLWQLDTGPGPLLTSNIHSLELTNNGEFIRIIPSLSGTLYKFDGTTVDPIPIKVENLLKSSFRYSDDLVIAGGIEKRTYGVNVKTGKVVYECTPSKCSQNRHNNEELLIIERNTQTVRAVDPRSGVERWNFSVGLNNVKFFRENCLESEPNNDWEISAIVPDGSLFATPIKPKPNLTSWSYKFAPPIVQVWRWDGRELTEINLFAPKNFEPLQHSESMPAIYIGMHEKQLYIQESVFMAHMLEGVGDTEVAVAEGKSLTKIPWNPIPALSGEHNRTEEDSTALSLLYSSEYINGKGYYFYAEELGCKQNHSLNSTTIETSFKQYIFEFKMIQWWKEILFILVNVICFQIWHRIGRRKERRLSQEELNRQKIAEYSSRYLQDFDTIQCLGKGGFGIVFQVKQKIDECEYAIKRITLPYDVNSRERVLREVKALAKLEHPNIVRYFCSWVESPPHGWGKVHDAPWILDCNFSVSATTNTKSMFNLTSTEPSFSKRNKSASVSIDISFRNDDSLRKPNDEDDDDDFIVFEDSRNKSKSVTFSKEIDEKTNSFATENSLVECSKSTIDSLDHWQKKINWRRPNRKHHSWDIMQNKDIILDEPPVYLYIQMQLCQKESLKEWLSNHLVRDVNESLDIFLQIMEAVEYVHLRGLIHRDLKPSNIFFSLDGQVKVGDFGLVKDMEDALGDSNASASFSNYGHTREVGTQLYMSPEQCNSRSYDFKVDIYSLGLIFFELLVPFTTDSERITVLTNIKKGKFPENFQEEFPESYDLIKSMLSEDPKKRLTTIGIKARPPYNLVNKKYNEEYHYRLPKFKSQVVH